MKIVIVADVLGESNNGTTIAIKRLIARLKARGHEIRVVSATKSEELGYYTLPKRNFYVFNHYIEENGVTLAKPDEEILRAALEGADVVHIALPFKAGKRAIRLAEEMKIPVTTACHCQAENVTAHLGLKGFKPANDIVYKYLYEGFYKYARFVHCPSKMIADVLREHGYGMDLRVISNGVAEDYRKIENPVRPKEWKDKYVVMFVGRLSREKMHKTLIEAVGKSKYADRIQLAFAGDGPLKKQIEREGSSLPNPPLISFYRQEELVNLLNCADLYVHPSDAEIEAISCMEAIACGLVPIISDSKASATNQFAIGKENLFRAGDSGDLARKIDFFIEHPEVKEEFKKKYVSFADRYAIDKCVDEMERMFSDAIASYGKEARKC